MKITVLFFAINLLGNISFINVADSNRVQKDSVKNSINLVKDLEIGNSNDGFIFGSLGLHVAVNTSGDIFIADIQNNKIQKFSEKGQFLNLIGKTGRGPGEFLDLADFKLDKNNQPIVLDLRLKRISIFDNSDYNSEATILIDNPVPNHFVTEIYSLTKFKNSFLLGYTPSYSNSDRIISEDQLYFVFNEKIFSAKDPILIVPSDEIGLNREGGNISIRVLQFGRKSITRLGPDDKIYSGWNNKLNINVYSLDGAKIRSINEEVNNIAIRNSDINKSFGEVTHDYFPAFDWFLVDDQSRVWVAVNTEDRQNYLLHIFDQNGELMDKINLPKAVELQVVKDNYAYGTKKAEDGTQSVVRYKIEGL